MQQWNPDLGLNCEDFTNGSSNMRTSYKRLPKKRSQSQRNRGIKTRSFVKLRGSPGRLLRSWIFSENPSFTQKEFCELRSKLNKGNFSKLLTPMARKRIEIDARNPQLKDSRWTRNRFRYVKVSNVKNMTIHLPASHGII